MDPGGRNVSHTDERRKWGGVHSMEQSATGVKAAEGEQGSHVGWGLEERGQLQPAQGVKTREG